MSEAATSNVTTGVANVEKPIPKKVLRRRKVDKSRLAETINELVEKLSAPNIENGKDIARRSLPQIVGFDAFLKDLAKADCDVETKSLDPEDLSPSQKHFNESKVRTMIENGTCADKPIIVSNDMFVVDGHHRWLAAAETDSMVKARVIDMKFDELVDFVKGKPYIEYKNLNERIQFHLKGTE